MENYTRVLFLLFITVQIVSNAIIILELKKPTRDPILLGSNLDSDIGENKFFSMQRNLSETSKKRSTNNASRHRPSMNECLEAYPDIRVENRDNYIAELDEDNSIQAMYQLLNKINNKQINLPALLSSEEFRHLTPDHKKELFSEMVRKIDTKEIDRTVFLPGYKD